ncbi:MAG: hypothetical protein HDS40_03170 [Bacteroides sp.]|nr:hypothetical protein [Bacteroides sp.]MBD5271244.1 hypothetical protein [Bacteroides sp.]
MKKFIIPALVVVAALCGVIGYFNQSGKHELSALTVANVEALTDDENLGYRFKTTTEEIVEELYPTEIQYVWLRCTWKVTIVDCEGIGYMPCEYSYDISDYKEEYVIIKG